MFLHKSHIWEYFVLEIWAKMFSANQIAGFFNQPYHQNKSMKQPEFLHVDTNSHELKVDWKFLGVGMVKDGYIKNELMEWTVFLHAGANSGKLKLISIVFEWMLSKLGWICWMSLWIEVTFCMLTVTHKLSVRQDQHCTLYLWFLNTSLLQLYWLDPWL